MVTRYRSALERLDRLGVRPGIALRRTLAAGYGRRELARDALAGLVVGVVALPLSMALAIASGVPPQYGLYTAIVAGAVVALLGGTMTQVTGPTAAFVVVLAPIASRLGLAGLLLASVMAGLILLGMGAFGAGRLIEFIPHPVTTGFTAGIAVVIGTLQLKDFLGLRPTANPEHYLERVATLVRAAPTLQPAELCTGLATLALLVLWPKLTSGRVPAALVALGSVTLVTALLAKFVPGFHVETITSRFGGIPATPPTFAWPWSVTEAGQAPLQLDFATIRMLVPSAFAIALLGAIESLLCAVVADGMSGTRHDPDAELLALGTGNVIAPFFGGFAATGAIARTTVNIRSGGASPLASVFHSLTILLAMLLLAPLLGWLPLASMAALLLTVAWRMAEVKHFGHILRVAPKSDVAVLLACFILTVVFDMVVGVTVGVMLAALLLMRRMQEIFQARTVAHGEAGRHPNMPRGAVVYEIAGPLFFGAAQRAVHALQFVGDHSKVVVLDIHSVPVLDVTGLVALESAISKLQSRKALVILSGVQAQPKRVLDRAGLISIPGKLQFAASMQEAAQQARAVLTPTAEVPVVQPASAGSEPTTRSAGP
ncbi:MAG TPA: C4-dicarboxylic acid transporter DauA, partial [Myxococcaceae bacterium]|nr:C4-dicarboxylic acid transporter DauA [Myxococcaceae bacterium]